MAFDKFTGTEYARSTTSVVALLVILLIGMVIVSALIFGGTFSGGNPLTAPETTIPTETAFTQTESTSVQETDLTITESPTVTPTTTHTQPSTPTATSIPTATRDTTETPGPYANQRYGEFVDVVFGETKSDTGVPVRIRGWRVVEGKILLIAMNLTDRSEDENRRVKQLNALVTSGYTQAVVQYDNGNIGGKIPNRLRIAEVNNTNSKPKMWYLNTSLAREYYLNKITALEFTDQYWDTMENQTAAQESYINRLDQTAGNVTLYNETAK